MNKEDVQKLKEELREKSIDELNKIIKETPDWDCAACRPDVQLCDGFPCLVHVEIWRREDEMARREPQNREKK